MTARKKKPQVRAATSKMKVLSRKLEELHIDPANLRTHDEVNLAAIRASLAKFGQQHPIIVDSKGMVVAGNGRLEAARALGWDTINVVVTDLEAIELTAFAIADNRTSDLSAFDGAALAATLRVLAADEEALAATGFDAEALAQALSPPDAEGNPTLTPDGTPLPADADPADTEGAEPSLALPAEHAPADPDRPPHASDVSILSGDCRERMAEFQPESFTAIVCDPPYELAFMGKRWDASGIAFDVEVWKQALRVLKPGGYLLAFGGTRTYHRLAVAIEDAGFEVRDCFAWMYGSGFPKSHDVGKAIDRAAGAERDVVGYGPEKKTVSHCMSNSGQNKIGARKTFYGEGVTDLAREWDGYGTALKPAYEPCIIARKPLIGTVAENVAAHGCGALNVDGARIGTEVVGWSGGGSHLHEGGLSRVGGEARPATGRWPANVLLDEEAACILDGQSGVTKSTQRTGRLGAFEGQDEVEMGHDDQGGASRFFFVSPGEGGTIEPCNAKDAGSISSQLSGQGDSAQSGARTEAEPMEAETQSASTGGTRSGSKRKSGASTRKIQSTGSEFLHESRLRKPSPKKSHVKPAEAGGQTDTMTTMTSPLASDGSVESATSLSMQKSEGRGGQDLAARRFLYTAKASTSERTHDGKVANTHATVKPIAVMRYLLNLVRQPKANRILDPFAGSGTTLIAAIREGLDVVGIELDPEHVKIIEARIAHEPTRPTTKATL